MTRQEHLDWCKQRANEYVAQCDLSTAWTSMLSDLGKHDDLCNHPAIQLGTEMFFGGMLNTPEKMKNFIDGFN